MNLLRSCPTIENVNAILAGARFNSTHTISSLKKDYVLSVSNKRNAIALVYGGHHGGGKQSVAAYVGCLSWAIHKDAYLKAMREAGSRDVHVVD